MKRRILFIIIGGLVMLAIAITVVPLVVSAADLPEETTGAEETEAVEQENVGDELESQAVEGLINGSGSKIDTVMAFAELFGISTEEAEAIVNNIIVFGDEHFEESDLWTALRADILSNPDKWIIIVVIASAFIALIAFIIRCLIKNVLVQTNTKLKLKDIDEHEAATSGKLDEIKILLGEIKEKEAELDEIKGENEELKGLLQNVKTLIEGESAAVDSLKANSETSLKVTEETALQIVQLLNIAMDRKVPIASAGARKLWYEDSVQKIKEKAGLIGAKDGESK